MDSNKKIKSSEFVSEFVLYWELESLDLSELLTQRWLKNIAFEHSKAYELSGDNDAFTAITISIFEINCKQDPNCVYNKISLLSLTLLNIFLCEQNEVFTSWQLFLVDKPGTWMPFKPIILFTNRDQMQDTKFNNKIYDCIWFKV